MTQPSGEQSDTQGSSSGGSARPGKTPKVDVLTVGHYTVHDHLLGREHTGLGVVAQVGEVLTVRPLAGHYVQVDPAAFEPLTADDV